MSELNLNAVMTPERQVTAGIGASGTNPAPGTADPARPEASAAANPFAALLSGILQGTQSLTPATDPLTSGSAPLNTEPPAGPAADLPCVVALPAGAGPPIPLPEASSAPESRNIYGNVLPAGGKILPAGVPGDGTANPAQAASAPEPKDTPPLVATRPPAGTRPGVSLADLAYSRQMNDAPGLATVNTTDASRSAAAMAFAGRSLAAARGAPAEPPVLPTTLNTDLPLNPTQNPTLSLATGAAPVAASASTDGLALQLSAADLLRTTMTAGAGTEFAGRQLAAFAAGDAGRAALSTEVAPGATGANSSASLFRHLGTTTLPGLQPLGDTSTFSAGLADRLLMLGGPGVHSARLKLYPEHLGELKVDIRIDDGSAEVWFATATPQAREAIEASLPRLRELFADQGIQLTRTQIDAGGGQMGNSSFGQERRMPDGAEADVPAWHPGRTGGGAGPAGRTAAGTSARLLDVWA